MEGWEDRELPGPYEILDLKDGESVRLRVVSWERGVAGFHFRRLPPGEVEMVRVLRVHLAAGSKAYPPHYWDIHQKRVISQLLPLLLARGWQHYEYAVTKHGRPPEAWFTVEKVPL